MSGTGDPIVIPAGLDVPAVLASILPGYPLPADGDHGPAHWARVLENGLRLASETSADPLVVACFALLHDARRRNESDDPDHGKRGAALAGELRGVCFVLGDGAFERLVLACRDHTHAAFHHDATIQACWDADRLDLGRVGIRPDPARLGSEAARRLLEWADGRAVRGETPEFYAREWLPVIRGRIARGD